jgi:uncharacterized protein YndB with AHSA1/START domain
MKTKEIKQRVTIHASPAAVFEALMNSERHGQFTGEPADITAKRGAPFTAYDGYIEGFNLDVEPGLLIVQAWRSENWPVGVWSIVTFKLSRAPGGKTRLTFTQAGVPAGDYQKKFKGWQTHYWAPLKLYLERR